MTQVQASIQLVVDFHGHLGETDQLQKKSAVARKSLYRESALALHGDRLAEFVGMQQRAEFHPLLTLDPTGHPSFEEIRDNLLAAVEYYNSLEFPLTFDTEPLKGPTAPDYTCIRLVWVDGHWVAIYNYDLVATDPTKVPSSGGLSARYNAALCYQRSIYDVQLP